MLERFFALITLVACAAPSTAQRGEVSDLNLEQGLAIAGRDPVSYFPEGGGKPRKGSAELSLVHAGVTYRFATEENRERFLSHPTRYEPAYGGWCAWAMREGDKVEVDPESFVVQGGRLMLFYDGLFADTRKKWRKDPPAYERAADAEWRKIATEAPRDPSVWNLDEGGLALGGLDPVTYVEEGGPKEGQAELETVYRGVRYRFADREHRVRFVATPDAYEPAFGGWCAFAMAMGEKAPVDTRAFLIQDGRLLLFHREGGVDTREPWQEDASVHLARADARWRELGARN